VTAVTQQRRQTGLLGEERAVRALRRRGYRILSRNFRCRYGEVDVVAEEGGTVVFVEVKTRRSDTYGLPALAVTRGKRRRMIRAALHYLVANRMEDRMVRFDVVAVRWSPAGWRTDILPGAFQAGE
jgi:putative endonuclease